MPAVSIIVPTRKRNHLLPRCLSSLEAQTFQDFEVVLVDDNPVESRVRSDPSLTAWLRTPRVKLIEHANPRNAATARNAGLQHAQGDWITYLDDDDAYHPEKLDSQMQLAAISGLPVGLCGYRYILPGRVRILRRTEERLMGEDLLFYFPGMSAVLHRRTDAVRFDPELAAGEDLVFYQVLIAHFGVREVFNVSRGLVDIHPQPGPRVNLNRAGHLHAQEVVARDFAPRYGPRAEAAFRARAQLQVLRLQAGSWQELIRVSLRLCRLRGVKDIRLILNTALFKIPVLRRFLVS